MLVSAESEMVRLIRTDNLPWQYRGNNNNNTRDNVYCSHHGKAICNNSADSYDECTTASGS